MPRLRFPSSRPWCFATLILATICLIAAHPALAKRAPESSPATAAHAMLLMRHPAPDIEPEALAPMRWEQGAQLQFGEASGIARRYWLRQPGIGSNAAPKTVAESFLQARASVLGLDAAKLGQTLELDTEKESPPARTSAGTSRWTACRSTARRSSSRSRAQGQVSSVQNNLAGELAVPTTPALSLKQAVQAGLATVRPTGRALGEYGAELAIVPLEGGARLAWLVSVPNEQPMGDWQVFVDARSGEVFGVVDRMVYADGTGQVFDPDPMSKMGDSSYVDNNDADTAVPFPGAYDIRTLPGLTLTSGTYSLDGPYARLIDNESPTTAPVTATHPDSFRYQRSPSGFEDVNCYFHLDHSERYIQSLGFTNVNNRVQEVDSHGLSGDDNSHYVPSTKRLAFGEGGVDDAEDADVIWHEYGHSIQDNIQPGWGGGQEGAMGEGFGDYWAGSYSLSLYPAFRPNFVFTWDGHNEFWAGRLLVDHGYALPRGLLRRGARLRHPVVLGPDRLLVPGRPRGHGQAGARPPLRARHLGHHGRRGEPDHPVGHRPLRRRPPVRAGRALRHLGLRGPRRLRAADHAHAAGRHRGRDRSVRGRGDRGLHPAARRRTRRRSSGASGAPSRTRWSMSPAGPPTSSRRTSPAPAWHADIRYYIRALDTNGGSATHPSGAPGNVHVFHVGPDVTPPVDHHTPLSDWPELTWPATVSATVTDNFGVASVSVDWTLNGLPKPAFALARVGVTDVYAAAFPSTRDSVAPATR